MIETLALWLLVVAFFVAFGYRLGQMTERDAWRNRCKKAAVAARDSAVSRALCDVVEESHSGR